MPLPTLFLAKPRAGYALQAPQQHQPCKAAQGSNLGMLAPLAEPETALDRSAFVGQPPVRFSGGGVINVDGGAIAASALVLAMLLALSLNRILGLERVLG